MDRRWVYFFADGNVRRGPFTLEQLREYPLRADTMVWREGMPAWSTLRDVPELWAVFAEKLVEMPKLEIDPPVATPEEVALAGAVPQTPLFAPPGGTLNYAQVEIKPASGAAITSLVCGIASLAVWCVPGGPFVTAPLGVLAIVYGVIGRKKVKRQEAGGGGMALSGLIMGILDMALFLVIFIFIGSLFYAVYTANPRPATVPALPPATAPSN